MFHRDDDHMSTLRLPGVSHLTSCLGGGPGTGIIVSNCTSPRNSTGFGRGLSIGHTRTIGGVLIGSCLVSRDEVSTSNGNINAVFRGNGCGHMDVYITTWFEVAWLAGKKQERSSSFFYGLFQWGLSLWYAAGGYIL